MKRESKLFDDEISRTSRDRIQFFIRGEREREGREGDRKRGKRCVTNRNDSLYRARATLQPRCRRFEKRFYCPEELDARHNGR